MRLQRVLNYMQANCHLDIETDNLARMSNYSTCHFIRAFSAAFGQTPHTVLVEYRLARAWHLLQASDLAVAEVAMASGFDNRCAFSRLFKRRYGINASELRLQSGASVRMPARSYPVARYPDLLAKSTIHHPRIRSSASIQQHSA
ncbi:MAG: AraC family transcriptional regulator [Dokdonella sp.]